MYLHEWIPCCWQRAPASPVSHVFAKVNGRSRCPVRGREVVEEVARARAASVLPTRLRRDLGLEG